METKANYVAVGIFTLAQSLRPSASSGGARASEKVARQRCSACASRLGVGTCRGSAVLFNGVKVGGDVRRVYIDVTNPSDAIADTEIDRLTPITQSTQADIGLAGLTGQANIELKGGNPAEPNLLEEAEAQDRVAEIIADPSAVTNLLQSAQDIFPPRRRRPRSARRLRGRGPRSTDTVGPQR